MSAKFPCFFETCSFQMTKVHIFWEGHKILQNLHHRFDRYNMEIHGYTVEISQKFEAFSEYMNFTDFYIYFSTIYDFFSPSPTLLILDVFIWFCSVKLQNFSKKIYLLATLVRPLCTGELADLYATTEFCIEVKTIEPLIFLRQWFQRPALRSLE